MSLVQTNGVELDIHIDRAAILRSLKLNPADPQTQALILVCERYNLDPLLKHMVLISGNPYVTRDGYLEIAHRSGKFDGMEVLATGADATHFTAKVAVYRTDMSHPFTYVGRFPKNKSMAKEYGPEMAIKVAEVMALRRAFNITGVGAADERWDDEADRTLQVASVPAGDPVFEAGEAQAAEELTVVDEETQKALADRIAELPVDYRTALQGEWKGHRLGSLKLRRLAVKDSEMAEQLVADAEARWVAEQERIESERPFTDDEPVDAEVLG